MPRADGRRRPDPRRGPVGCALALALRDSRLKVAIVERDRRRRAPRSGRSRSRYASRLILERLGAWRGAGGDADRDHPRLAARRLSAARGSTRATPACPRSATSPTTRALARCAARARRRDSCHPDETPARCVRARGGRAPDASEKALRAGCAWSRWCGRAGCPRHRASSASPPTARSRCCRSRGRYA